MTRWSFFNGSCVSTYCGLVMFPNFVLYTPLCDVAKLETSFSMCEWKGTCA